MPKHREADSQHGKAPTLALCIPAYNAAQWLPNLLRTAVDQEIPFHEILVYDDASTDATSEVATAHGAKVIRGETNRGTTYGKNQLLSVTESEWIHFHDADDVLLPSFSRTVHRWIAAEDAPDVVLLGYEYREYPSGALLMSRVYDDARLQDDSLRYAIEEQINGFAVYRATSLRSAGGFDEDPLVLYNEDVAVHIRLAAAGLSFRADPEMTSINYRMPSSMSVGNGAKCARAHYHVMRRTAERVDSRYHNSIADKLWVNAGIAAMYLDWPNARDCIALARALGQRAPRHASPAFRALATISPMGAIYAREFSIRTFKKHLRQYA